MRALVHIILVLLTLAASFIVFLLKIILLLALIFSFLLLCIKYETFGTSAFTLLLVIVGLGLVLLFIANVCEVSADIKRKGVRKEKPTHEVL